MTVTNRFGASVFTCRRAGTPRRPQPPRHTGAGVRLATCHCGAEFMAVQGQAERCPKCGARKDAP